MLFGCEGPNALARYEACSGWVSTERLCASVASRHHGMRIASHALRDFPLRETP
jgi:hypothetical protein